MFHKVLTLLFIIFLPVNVFGACVQQSNLDIRVRETFGALKYSVTDISLPAADELPDDLIITCIKSGQVKVINLKRKSVRGGNYELLTQKQDGKFVHINPGIERTYQGYVAGEPDAIVAASLLPCGLNAKVFKGETDGWSIIPMKIINPSSERSEHIV